MLPYVISSRLRLARNLKNYRFPEVACIDERRAVLESVRESATSTEWFSQVQCIGIDTLHPLDRRVLEEKRLISPFLATQGTHRLAIIANAADFSILVNEEDHVRIQAFQSGLQLERVWNTTRLLEKTLKERLDFAYSERDGYLTTCSSNTGTGIRVSVMMFLPGLILSKRITPVLRKVIASGYTVRGMAGEGSQSLGYLLQISKQIGRGMQTHMVLRKLEQLCHGLIREERQVRLRMLVYARKKVRKHIDQVWKHLLDAEVVGFQPGIRMLARLRLGTVLQMEQRRLGALHDQQQDVFRHLAFLDKLCVRIQPGHVLQYGLRAYQHDCLKTQVTMSPQWEDALRANVIQKELGKRVSDLEFRI